VRAAGFASYGVEWRGTRPLARLREAHEVLCRFLAAGRIDFRGEFYRYSGLLTAARPVQQPLPLKLGAMEGPGSFRLAGEIADGLHVACAHSPEALAYAAENVREGAGRVGRQLDSSFDLCASVLGAISTDSAAAKEAARVAAAFYISSMAPELVERDGIAGRGPSPEWRPPCWALGGWRRRESNPLLLVASEVLCRQSFVPVRVRTGGVEYRYAPSYMDGGVTAH